MARCSPCRPCASTRSDGRAGALTNTGAELDGHRYLAGGGWSRRNITVAVRWDTVTLMDPSTGLTVVEYGRAYGDDAWVVADPTLVMPMLARRPHA